MENSWEGIDSRNISRSELIAELVRLSAEMERQGQRPSRSLWIDPAIELPDPDEGDGVLVLGFSLSNRCTRVYCWGLKDDMTGYEWRPPKETGYDPEPYRWMPCPEIPDGVPREIDSE